jgi:hypothetical protein
MPDAHRDPVLLLDPWGDKILVITHRDPVLLLDIVSLNHWGATIYSAHEKNQSGYTMVYTDRLSIPGIIHISPAAALPSKHTAIEPACLLLIDAFPVRSHTALSDLFYIIQHGLGCIPLQCDLPAIGST